jgi:hypothetical protein
MNTGAVFIKRKREKWDATLFPAGAKRIESICLSPPPQRLNLISILAVFSG